MASICGAGETAAADAFDVDAARGRRVAVDQHEGRHVLGQAGVHADKGVRADLAELVDAGETGQDGPVSHFDVAGQLGVVREDGVAADLAIVRQVDVGAHPVVVAQAGDALVLRGAGVEGAEFADGVAVADFQPGRLRRPTSCPAAGRRSRRTGKTCCPRRCVVWPSMTTCGPTTVRGADDDVRADDGIRPHFDGGVELRAGIDDGGGMNQAHRLSPRPCWRRRSSGWCTSGPPRGRRRRRPCRPPCTSRCRARRARSRRPFSAGRQGRPGA